MLLVFPKSQSGLGGGCKTNSESFPGTCLQCSHSLQTCSLPLLRISLAFIIAKGLPCSVVQLCGCGGLWALFSMTFHNPNPSIITLRPHCWNVPHVSCLASLPADHNDNASWLLSLMLLLWGGICYVSCNLTHLQLGFKSGFKRLVAISWLWSSWRPTWGDAYPELRAANGLWGSCSALLISQLCPSWCWYGSCRPAAAPHPAQTCCSSQHSPRLSLHPKLLRWDDWKEGRRFSAGERRNLVGLFVC